MDRSPFSPRTVKQRFLTELEQQYSPEEAVRLAEILFMEWKGWSRAETSLRRDEPINRVEFDRFMQALDLLRNNHPIQYIIGRVLFHGNDILVAPGVLIPRPETEELVDRVVKDYMTSPYLPCTILDIGTGSGCIAISLKKAIPGSDILAIDVSEIALDLAKRNATHNHCEIGFLRYDILSGTPPLNRHFDMIISNPPYVTESEKIQMKPHVIDQEPHSALFVPDDDPLRFYRAIAGFAPDHLHPSGSIYLEINERFGSETEALLKERSFGRTEVIKDFSGRDRFIKAIK